MRDALVAGFLLLCVAPAEALTIRSDELWLAARCPPEHELPELDDSTAWAPVAYPWIFLAPKEFPPDPWVRPMWEASGSRQACLQRSFDLPDVPGGTALAHLWVDELYQFFLNDQLVGASTKRFEQGRYDVTSLLRPGRNVIRLNLDGRAYTVGAMFSLIIPGVAEEPLTAAQRRQRAAPWWIFTLTVIAIGLFALIVARLRRRTVAVMARVPALLWVAGMLILAATLEWLFLTQPFYDAEWIHPWCYWNWPTLASTSIVLVALILWASGDVERPESPLSPRWIATSLAVVIALALVLRTYRIDILPTGMWGDESLNGNEALNLYDHPDRTPQVWSNSVGGRGTLFLYVIGAVFQMVGPTYLTLKVAPVMMGVLAVPAIYFVGRVAFGARVGLWAAFLLAVSRYHIHYSRMAWEAICVPTFSLAGFALLLQALLGRSWTRLSALAAGAIFAAGLYTYAAYRAVPAIVAVFLAWSAWTHSAWLRQRRVEVLSAAVLAIAVSAPLLIYAYGHPTVYWQRYSDVSLTHFMQYYGTPLPWLHQIGRTLLSLNHKGDEIIRHNLPNAPHFDPITAGLTLIGMVTATRARTSWGVRLLWSWFIVYAALASLTRDGPHATRLIGLIPVVILFAARGMTRMTGRLRDHGGGPALAVVLALVVVIGATSRNAYEYFVLEANHPSADVMWNASGRRLCDYVSQREHVELYRDAEIALQSDSPCEFLARGRFTRHDLRIDDLRNVAWREALPRGAAIVFAPGFLLEHQIPLSKDVPDLPQLDLPVAPHIERNRRGLVMYYLYQF